MALRPEDAALIERLKVYRYSQFGVPEPKWLIRLRAPIYDHILRDTYGPSIVAELNRPGFLRAR